MIEPLVVVVNGDREHLLGVALTDNVIVEDLADFLGRGDLSRDFTSEDLFSSRMMSMQSSTHSSQMKTVGPAISLRTSCWLLPQNEQYSVFLELLVPTLLIHISVRRSTPYARSPHFRELPAQSSK